MTFTRKRFFGFLTLSIDSEIIKPKGPLRVVLLLTICCDIWRVELLLSRLEWHDEPWELLVEVNKLQPTG